MSCKNLRRSFVRFSAIICGDVLNPLWHSRDRRHETRSRALGRILGRYLKKVCFDASLNVLETEVSEGEERIFSIWLQGEENAPDLVKSCFASIRAHSGKELVVLDENSLDKWITLPETIMEKYRAGKIQSCHFADICRIELLHKYGGYWMDATCFMISPIPRFISDQDFFVYMAGNSFSGSYSYIQNCFIRARKGAYLLEAWRSMILDYWTKQDYRTDYFQHQVMFRILVENNEVAAAHFAVMPKVDQAPTHRLWYFEADDRYNPAVIEKLASDGYFFQKTTYRTADKAIPGSYREYIVDFARER